MEERKTIFDYVGQVFMIFGITVVIMNIFCVLFGASAREYSTMFSLGNAGLSVSTMAQYLLISAITVGLRYIFFTDVLIKNMSVAVRTVWMILLVLLSVAGFILIFDWFPADMWQPWAMFFICFGICFVISAFFTALKEKEENRRMQEALGKLKAAEGKEEQAAKVSGSGNPVDGK